MNWLWKMLGYHVCEYGKWELVKITTRHIGVCGWTGKPTGTDYETVDHSQQRRCKECGRLDVEAIYVR